MRLCSVKDVREGMVLGKSIYFSNNKLLLGAGYRITSDIKLKLIERGYSHVYIMEEGTEKVIPEDIISDETRQQAQAKLSDKVKKIEESLQFQDLTHVKAVELLEKGYLKHINITYGMRKIIDEILREISETGAEYLNTIMIKSKDNYFIDHAINTTILAIIVGKKYKFAKSELKSLALGTFLHDIGKVIIEQIKASNNIKEEDYLYKEHPTFGYLLLKNNNASMVESQIVNQHHENQDGSGFPIGLKGQNLPPVKSQARQTKGYIFRLAEICTVVDAYDNMVLDPRKEKQMSPLEVIKRMLLDSGSIYNKNIIQTLVQVIAVFPVGAYVRIVNIVDPTLIGNYGVVAKINKDHFDRPVIIITKNKYGNKIKPIMLDTIKLKLIELELIV